MKIVFLTMPFGKKPAAVEYKMAEGDLPQYEGKLMYGINAILAKELKSGDEVRIVRLLNKDHDAQERKTEFEEELASINKEIGAKITYSDVEAQFMEDKVTQEEKFYHLVDKLEQNAEIYADITFGQKPSPILLLSTLGFAEKFFDAEIKRIVYSNRDIDPVTGDFTGKDTIFDVTSLLYINTLTSVMEAPDGEAAKAKLRKFLSV